NPGGRRDLGSARTMQKATKIPRANVIRPEKVQAMAVIGIFGDKEQVASWQKGDVVGLGHAVRIAEIGLSSGHLRLGQRSPEHKRIQLTDDIIAVDGLIGLQIGRKNGATT